MKGSATRCDCGGDSQVLDTRVVQELPGKRPESLRRRRRCLKCDGRWTTLELRALKTTGQGGEIAVTDVLEVMQRANMEVANRLRSMAKDFATRIKGVPDDGAEKDKKQVRPHSVTKRRRN